MFTLTSIQHVNCTDTVDGVKCMNVPCGYYVFACLWVCIMLSIISQCSLDIVYTLIGIDDVYVIV